MQLSIWNVLAGLATARLRLSWLISQSVRQGLPRILWTPTILTPAWMQLNGPSLVAETKRSRETAQNPIDIASLAKYTL